MKRTSDSMKFDVELGKRLRELRLEAGLTQDALAVVMGRFGKRGGTQLGQLELGNVRQPSLAVVADYLRACRASFVDIAELLDGYTRRPVVYEAGVRAGIERAAQDLPPRAARQAIRYDIKHERPEVGLVPDPDRTAQRLLRFRRSAAQAIQREEVDKVLLKAVNEAGVRPVLVTVEMLRNHGHKYFAALRRMRRATPDKRDAELAEIEEKAVVATGLPREAIQYIQAAVRREFDEMLTSGALDWLPAVTIDQLPARSKRSRPAH
jgi:transcriptional regulator with XRE-family HTH domain